MASQKVAVPPGFLDIAGSEHGERVRLLMLHRKLFEAAGDRWAEHACRFGCSLQRRKALTTNLLAERPFFDTVHHYCSCLPQPPDHSPSLDIMSSLFEKKHGIVLDIEPTECLQFVELD